MFVKNQLIHFPDSPRQQNLAAWLGDKKVLVKNKTNKTIQQLFTERIYHGLFNIAHADTYNIY